MPKKDRNAVGAEIQDHMSREEIVSAFRLSMADHFRAHVPGTNINEETLLCCDYLSHFHKLTALFEALSTGKGAKALKGWQPLTYEEHFARSGAADQALAIAAYRGAPQDIRTRFDEAVARLQSESLRLIAMVGRAGGGRKKLKRSCAEAADLLRDLIGEAAAIANGKMPAKRDETPPSRKIAV